MNKYIYKMIVKNAPGSLAIEQDVSFKKKLRLTIETFNFQKFHYLTKCFKWQESKSSKQGGFHP